jgi:hypothetical protein
VGGLEVGEREIEARRDLQRLGERDIRERDRGKQDMQRLGGLEVGALASARTVAVA